MPLPPLTLPTHTDQQHLWQKTNAQKTCQRNINIFENWIFFNSLLYLNFQQVHLVFIFELSFDIFLNPYIFPDICFSYLTAFSWYFSPIHKEKKRALRKHLKYFIYCFIYCFPVIQKLNLKPSHMLFFTVKGRRASLSSPLKPIKRITGGVCPRRFRVEKGSQRVNIHYIILRRKLVEIFIAFLYHGGGVCVCENPSMKGTFL